MNSKSGEYKRSNLSRNINLGSKQGSTASLKKEDSLVNHDEIIPGFEDDKN